MDTSFVYRVKTDEAAKKIDLEIDSDDAKTTVPTENGGGANPGETVDLNYNKVSGFRYSGATLSPKIDWSKKTIL